MTIFSARFLHCKQQGFRFDANIAPAHIQGSHESGYLCNLEEPFGGNMPEILLPDFSKNTFGFQ